MTTTDTSGTETDSGEWRQFAPPRTSHVAAGLGVFCEDDCDVKAREVGGYPGCFVATFGDLITLHGSLDTLARLAAEMTAAVEALRPVTVDEALESSLADAKAIARVGMSATPIADAIRRIEDRIGDERYWVKRSLVRIKDEGLAYCIVGAMRASIPPAKYEELWQVGDFLDSVAVAWDESAAATALNDRSTTEHADVMLFLATALDVAEAEGL